MLIKEQSKTRNSMGKIILFTTVASGFIAAYLMYRRGESLSDIVKATFINPVGSMLSEVRNAV
jgi:hypothetical protein